jgi:hypothetical protein
MLIALCGSDDRALKTDRSLIDPIIKLKADCPKIQTYLHISQCDSLIDTGHMRLVAFTLFDTDQEVARYLARVKHLTRSGTCHLFF